MKSTAEILDACEHVVIAKGNLPDGRAFCRACAEAAIAAAVEQEREALASAAEKTANEVAAGLKWAVRSEVAVRRDAICTALRSYAAAIRARGGR